MKLKQTEDGVSWGHRYVKQQQDVLPVVEVGGFDLEQIGRMGHKVLALVNLSFELSGM